MTRTGQAGVLGTPFALALLAIAAAASPSSGGIEPILYEGNGFVRPLAPGGYPAWAGLLDSDADGVLELAVLGPTGHLDLHDRFTEYDQRAGLDGFTACAVVRESDHRLFGLQGDQLVEVRRVDDGPWFVEPVHGPSLSGATHLIASDHGHGAFLLVIDQGGARASVFDVEQGFLLDAQRWAGEDETQILDLERMDWNGDGQQDLVLVTAGGLRVYDPSGARIHQLDAPGLDAFAEVVPGSTTQWGHDLLLFHNRAPGVAVIDVLNAFHAEVLYVDPLQLESIAVVDLSPTPGHELVLARGDDRSAVIVKQFATPIEGAPRFGIDFVDTNLIDLRLEDSSAVAGAARVAVADLDGDGDEDLVFADDRGLVQVITSEWNDGNLRRARPPEGSELSPEAVSSQAIEHELRLHLPNNATGVDVEVWFKPDPWAGDPVEFVWSSQLPATATGWLETCIQFPRREPSTGAYYFLYRPVGAGSDLFPAWVGAWSLDLNVHLSLVDEEPSIYAWTPISEDPSGPGGTTQRPVIPPPGTSGT